jgi:hypothetical protein
LTTVGIAGISPSDALAPTLDATHTRGPAPTVDGRVWESAVAPARRMAGLDRGPGRDGREHPVTPADPSMRPLLFFDRHDRTRVD